MIMRYDSYLDRYVKNGNNVSYAYNNWSTNYFRVFSGIQSSK